SFPSRSWSSIIGVQARPLPLGWGGVNAIHLPSGDIRARLPMPLTMRAPTAGVVSVVGFGVTARDTAGDAALPSDPAAPHADATRASMIGRLRPSVVIVRAS